MTLPTLFRCALNMVLSFFFLATPIISAAQQLTVEDYVNLDLTARQLTLDGAKARLALLQDGADVATQVRQDNQIRQQVDNLYHAAGMTAAGTLNWAARHAQAIADYLARYPNRQADYDRLASQLDEVSRRIDALVKP